MRTKTCSPIEQHRKEMIDKIKQLGQSHSIWSVFEDFLALSAISISNAVDHLHFEEREKMYFDIIKKYNKQELDLFPSMFADLIMELQRFSEYPQDVLGEIFHDLELHNKYKGQFFTPNHISEFMGQISVQEKDKIIEKNGYITVCEPCAGSGTLILGFAKAMKEKEYNYQQQMLVTAVDIDIKCVYMTYIQLSLYGIPAIVVHGDSLTVKEWSHWYTPMFYIGNWQYKKEPCYGMTEKISSISKFNSNGQLTFF